MSTTDDFRDVVTILRNWDFHVTEWNGCYGRNNGSGWRDGVPVGHINHHYVCSMNPDQGYINGLVGNLAGGSVVNWFADVHGVAYLVGTGPMNHAGTGNSSVLNLTKANRPPPGPSNTDGDMSGNSSYSGTECQHPGDSTPWPAPMLDVMVAINAAEFLVWSYSHERAINHYEWTGRKIDMSAGGGRNDSWAGDELRRRVKLRMNGVHPEPEPEPSWFETVGGRDMLIIGADGRNSQTLITGDRAVALVDSATSKALQDAGVPYAHVTAKGYDNLKAVLVSES